MTSAPEPATGVLANGSTPVVSRVMKRRFLLGSRHADLLAFALVLFLLLLTAYRLRVYYRYPVPPQKIARPR